MIIVIFPIIPKTFDDKAKIKSVGLSGIYIPVSNNENLINGALPMAIIACSICIPLLKSNNLSIL